jgi:hypothetical protein
MKGIAFLIISFSLLNFTSCVKTNRCEEPITIDQSAIITTFKNSSGQYLYAENNSLYNKDSLKIFDALGNNLQVLYTLNEIPNTLNRYYLMSFGSIYNQSTDQSSFASELCKNFIVQYNSNERDTITVCFKSTNTKCGSVQETLKVYNKGQLLTSVSNQVYADVVIIKN